MSGKYDEISEWLNDKIQHHLKAWNLIKSIIIERCNYPYIVDNVKASQIEEIDQFIGYISRLGNVLKMECHPCMIESFIDVFIMQVSLEKWRVANVLCKGSKSGSIWRDDVIIAGDELINTAKELWERINNAL